MQTRETFQTQQVSLLPTKTLAMDGDTRLGQPGVPRERGCLGLEVGFNNTCCGLFTFQFVVTRSV